MNIYITLDYELFFGTHSGTASQCIINPTNDLLKLLDPYEIKISFFVDSGYLLALEKFKSSYPELEEDYEQVCGQIRKLADAGHGIELHVHPHWQDSYYDGKRWIFDTSRYKLSDFNSEQVLNIVSQHCKILTSISGTSPAAYRAGGWSVQPFAIIGKALKENGIHIDSSVFPRGHYDSPNQTYDFRKAPRYITKYFFKDDPSIPEEKGEFIEIPISSIKVLPTFYWKFALKKISKSGLHQSYGDGFPVKMPNKKKFKLLTTSSYSVVSMDGYKASLLHRAFNHYCEKTDSDGNFVIIGHPKAFTRYGLTSLKSFIENTTKANNYQTFRNYSKIE